MEAPSSLKLSLAILILRTGLFTQDEVASHLECGKPTIVKVEAWFKELPFAEAETLCCDRSLMEEALSLIAGSKEGLLPVKAMKVGSISSVGILRHYKKDDYLKQKIKRIPAIEYKETPHKQKMRELAANLRDKVSLPFILGSFIANQESQRSRERLVFTMRENGQVKIEFGSAEHLSEALDSHLQTGGFPNVLINMNAWRKGVEDNLTKCNKFLVLVKNEHERIYEVSIPIQDRGQHGLAIYFPMLVCADAIESAGGSAHFSAFSYTYEQSNLRFGAYVIYYGVPDEDLKVYELAHTKFRNIYTGHPYAKNIAKARKSLYQTQAKIKLQLQEFVDMEHVPGQCDLCAPRET